MQQPVTMSVDNNGIIRINFFGDLLAGQVPAFQSAIQAGRDFVKSTFEKSGKKVKILLDMTKFSGNYNAEALRILSEFAAGNKDYVYRTASFGGSDKVKTAGEIATLLSGRENIKIFNTEDEAFVWLQD